MDNQRRNFLKSSGAVAAIGTAGVLGPATAAAAVTANQKPIASAGTGTDAGLRTDLADPAIGDALVAGKRTETQALPFTLHDINQDRFIHAKSDCGAVGNDPGNGTGTNDSPALVIATQIGLNKTVFFSKGGYRVSSNVGFTSTIGLFFEHGAFLYLDNGVSVTIDGPIWSQSGSSIFRGPGSVIVTFGSTLNNFFAGPYAGVANVPGAASAGTQNTAFGAQALRTNVSGYGHTAVGTNALRVQNGGFYNVAVGVNALYQTTDSIECTAVGMNSQQSSASGHFNVSIGTNSLYSLTTGQANTGLGHNAGYSAITTIGMVAVGSQSAYANTAHYTVAVGADALRLNTTGAGNVGVGPFVLDANTTGAQNTAIGNIALGRNVTGNRNTSVGSQSLAASTGDENTACGEEALNVSTGTRNTAIGYVCLSTATTGGNNTGIGYNAQPSAVGVSNEVTLGNTSVATLRCQVALTVLSDARDKKNIIDVPVGLDFLNQLRPVKFEWDRRDGSKVGVSEAGFVAQELDMVQKSFDAEDYLRLVYKSNPEKLEATPANLLPVMVKAIQELSAQVNELRRMIGRKD